MHQNLNFHSFIYSLTLISQFYSFDNRRCENQSKKEEEEEEEGKIKKRWCRNTEIIKC